MALDVEVEVPVLVRIRLILLAAVDDAGLKAETPGEPSWDAPRRRIARTESDCMILSEWIDQASYDGKRNVTIVRMQCHQLLQSDQIRGFHRKSFLAWPRRLAFRQLTPPSSFRKFCRFSAVEHPFECRLVGVCPSAEYEGPEKGEGNDRYTLKARLLFPE